MHPSITLLVTVVTTINFFNQDHMIDAISNGHLLINDDTAAAVATADFCSCLVCMHLEFCGS